MSLAFLSMSSIKRNDLAAAIASRGTRSVPRLPNMRATASPSRTSSFVNAPLFTLHDKDAVQKLYHLGSVPGVQVRCKSPESAEDATKKYGLEVGLFRAMKSGNKADAKSLLKKYGSAYLATSISLAAVSFGICYVLVDNGVDVAAVLSKFGIDASGTTTKAGTAAIAYAAHKAASPIRFPPTVALTPIVAEKLFGRKVEEEGPPSTEESTSSQDAK